MEQDFDNSDLGGDKGSELETPFFAPYQKPVLPKSGIAPINMDLSLSSGGDSSADSVKEGSGSPSSSSSSGSEAQFSNRSVNTDDKVLPEGIRLKEDFPDLEQVGEENTDNILSERKNRGYDELLRKLRKSEEIIELKNQIEQSEGQLDNVRKELKMEEDDLEYEKGQVVELQKQTAHLETHVPDCSHKIANLKIQTEESEGQLDNVQKELKMKEDDLEYEKGQVLELQKQTADFETHVPDCSNKIIKLVEQLEVAQEQLKVSNDEKTKLKEELKNRYSLNHELQGQLKTVMEVARKSETTIQWVLDWGAKKNKKLEDEITQYQAIETIHYLEVQKLKAEKDRLHSDNASLSKEQKVLDSRLKECEARSKAFERKIKQSEAEKLKLEKLHASEQRVLQGQISSLKEELDKGRHDVETVNREFDQHKQKYDMLMTEKDGANAKTDKLMAEVSSRDNQIANMERELLQLQAQQAELISVSEARLNLVNELKLKLEELENEVTRQNAVISQYQAIETIHYLEVQKLKAEKDQLYSDNASLSKEQKVLDSRLKECEARSKAFERKIKQSEAEKLKLEKLHASQQRGLQGQISSLKEELDQGRHDVETVNREFDQHKQKYDMLMTERDGANAKTDKLMAEVSSRDNQIANMERELLQLQAQQAELISVSEARLNLVNELKLKLEELENEVTRQNAVISDRAEEKREAIRQLCISLEHYRSEYRERLRAFARYKRHAVGAS